MRRPETPGGELLEGAGVAFSGGLAAGPQLGGGPLDERGGPEALEQLEGDAQTGAGVGPAPDRVRRLAGISRPPDPEREHDLTEGDLGTLPSRSIWPFALALGLTVAAPKG